MFFSLILQSSVRIPGLHQGRVTTPASGQGLTLYRVCPQKSLYYCPLMQWGIKLG